MEFTVINKNGTSKVSLNPAHVYVVGYSGSNKEKTMAHIRELEEQLHVAPPKRIPTIFEVARENLTQDRELTFVGNQTSGECEYVILICEKKIYIGLGSDHTDRALEAINVPKAKQVCLKPIGNAVWEYDEIQDHFNQIRLESKQDGQAYQTGDLSDILSVEEILGEIRERVGDYNNCIIFSGTVPLVNGYAYGQNFELALIDDVLERRITFDYDVHVVPDEAR